MRPVNLIPPEERSGDRAPLRAGALSYIVVGAFAAILIAAVALVFTQNQITEREGEIAELEVARDAAQQRAEALAPYAQFASLQQQRELTISGLAASRFDWERVLRELALVIPAEVSLNELEATAAGDASSTTTAGVTGPSLTLSGCAANHEVVASFVAALKDIDGVTRVGLNDSIADVSGDAEGASTGVGACNVSQAASFTAVAAFDDVPDPAAQGTVPPPSQSAASPTEIARKSQKEQVEKARNAKDLIPGVSG